MEQVIAEHASEYDVQPQALVHSPARFHLMGDHSWFFKDKTISMAVDLPVYVAVSFRNDSALRFYFPQLKEHKRANLSSLKYRREDRWANSIKAMIYGFQTNNQIYRGMNFTIYSDILPSAGLGITAAIKAATAIALCKLHEIKYTKNTILQIIEQGNRFFLGMANYLSDINTVLFAKKNTCVLTNHLTGQFELLPFKFKDISIVLTDARVPRISVWQEENLRTGSNLALLKQLKHKTGDKWEYEQSEGEINEVLSEVSEDTRRHLMSIIKEAQFVDEAANALRDNNFSHFARCVNKSHEILRDYYEITCPEIDWLIKRIQEMDTSSARTPDICSRITGKGFGRCTYALIKTSEVDAYLEKLQEYERIFSFHPESYVVKPVSGACVAK